MKHICIGLLLLTSLINYGQNLRTLNKNIINSNGKEVILKGVGLGGWMLQEGYMMNSSGGANTQFEFKQKLNTLIGTTETEKFYENWRKNFVTEQDLDSIAKWGFNSVRLPMHYNLFTLPIEDEPIQGQNTWLPKGFEMVDNLLTWCKARNIYLILDLHAAPGGQGHDQAISDYDTTKPSLWESPLNKSKTIALWRKIAERYKNEPWIGGYDILNEPNWDLDTNELRDFYIQITNTIRVVDQNHIIFIEGNWFANDYSGLTPPWDSNMVYSFHKYWSDNGSGSIDWVLNMRNQYNVPLWCGESGENSNVWYRDAVKLYEDNNIGWAWWPWKRIATIVSPFSVNSNPKYESIIKYWKGEQPAPTTANAIQGLKQLTDDLLVDNNVYYKDVVDALIRQPQQNTHIPFKKHVFPGVIHLSDYDLGTNGVAYYDVDNANYSLTTGQFQAWNSGWNYRNDGVDIETSTDNINSNGYQIGFAKDQEWMNYTVTVAQTGFYNINFRYASVQAGGQVQFSMNDVDVAGSVVLGNSGGWNKFSSKLIPNVYLESGIQTLKVKVIGTVGYNMTSVEFKNSTDPVPALQALSSSTNDDEKSIKITVNQPLVPQSLSASNFSIKVNNVTRIITSAEIDPNNNRVILLKLKDFLYYLDGIRVYHDGNILTSTYNSTLDPLVNYSVSNNLKKRALIAGRIQAEEFTTQQGLTLETTTDTDGGQNIGYTDSGDFAEYRVYVAESGTFNVSIRSAAQNQQGQLELTLISNGVSKSLGFITTPVTAAWQTWKTTTIQSDMLAGVYTLKMRVVQPGFNLNWMQFDFVKPLSVESIKDPNVSINVYPNPSSDNFNIVANDAIIINKLQIIDQNGRSIKDVSINNNNTEGLLDLSDLTTGVYFLMIDSNKGKFIKRLIKK